MTRAVTALLLPTCLALALTPGMARANAYTRVEQAYATTGTITPCEFTSRQLSAALKQAPTYDQEYYGDFIDAVQTALGQQAAGRCGSARGTRPGVAQASAAGRSGSGSLRGLAPPASVTASTGGALPMPLLLALCLLAAATALGLVIGTARLRGWSPSWAQAARHSLNEAEYRLLERCDGVRERARGTLTRR